MNVEAFVHHALSAAPPPPSTGPWILGAAALALAGVLVSQYVQGRLARRSDSRTQESLKQTQASLELAAEQARRLAERELAGAMSSRFSEAASQLGHDQAPVRLAGVYAMARLADDWPEQRRQCVDVLCAYIRLPYEPDPNAEGSRAGDREVRRMIIRQIRDHMRPQAASRWDGCNFLFEGATLDCGDLSRAVFGDGSRVSFHNVTFVGSTFLLNGVELLKGSRMYFSEARATDGKITLDDATIRQGASLSFRGADLSDPDVERTGLTIESEGDVEWGPLRPTH